MNKPPLSKIAAMFGCSVDQVRAKFLENAADLRAAADRAASSRTGKVSGKTAAQWLQLAIEAEARANSKE